MMGINLLFKVKPRLVVAHLDSTSNSEDTLQYSCRIFSVLRELYYQKKIISLMINAIPAGVNWVIGIPQK